MLLRSISLASAFCAAVAAPRRRSPRHRGRALCLAASGLLCLTAPLAGEEIATQVKGEVILVEGFSQATRDALTAHGVTVGVNVAIELIIDSEANGVFDGKSGHMIYAGAVVDASVTIGSYHAFHDPHEFISSVQVGDDVSILGGIDNYVAQTDGSDTDSILKGNQPFSTVYISLDFSDSNGSTLSNNGVVQDLEDFPHGIGVVSTSATPGGILMFSIDPGSGGGSGGGQDPTAIARKALLKAASKFARSVLAAEARAAKAPPDADPFGDKLATAIDKAEETFAKKFLMAVDKAQKQGGVPPLPRDALDEVSAVLLLGFEGLADALLVGVDADVKHDRVLRGKLLTAVGRKLAGDFMAHSSNATKPSASKLAQKLESSRKKLLDQTGKAIEVATKKGVNYAGPKPAEAASAVTAIVDDFVALTEG